MRVYHYFYYLALACLTLGMFTERCRADEEFSLVIDPFTGAASLRNDGAAAVDLDGYFVKSVASPLNTEAWATLGDSGAVGWTATASDSGNRLGEVNLFGSLSVGVGESVSIGNPYPAFAPGEFGESIPGGRTMDFSYTLVNESSAFSGDVEFSAQNTVVLVVDPSTGSSMIQNQSGFDVELDGYIVQSVANAIDVDGWAPLSGSTAGWASSSGRVNRVGEGNLFGATSLPANGGSLPLGNLLDPDMLNDELDVALEITIASAPSSIDGGVLFRSLSSVAGDCNGDGMLTIADANCTAEAELDALLGGLNPPSLRGDANGDGTVNVQDFLVISRNFNSGTQYTDGDFNRNGTVNVQDFLILSRNFNQSGGAAAAVPEPSAGGLMAIGMVVAILTRRRRK